MTQSRPPEDATLDVLFADARKTPAVVPDALIARVMADAVAEMPRPKRLPLWRQFLGVVGGWPAMAGLAMTACVGVWAGGVLSDDLNYAFGLTESTSLEIDDGLGAFDLMLVDG